MMKRWLLPTAVLSIAAIGGLLALTHGSATATPATAWPGQWPQITIAVTNLDTQRSIRRYETVPAVTPFQVSVSGNGVDCAGQFVVTALGASGAPPSVLVQFWPFIVGPAVGTDLSSSPALTAGVLPTGRNAFKISATCNGAALGRFAVARPFEFFVGSS
jgi:hypothetical protein